MEINYALIGAKIKYLRTQAGLSQEELAEFADVSPVYISNIERGEKSPSLKTIVSVAIALNTSMDSLLPDSLPLSKANQFYRWFEVLSDCTKEENDIILENSKALKAILQRYRISK